MSDVSALSLVKAALRQAALPDSKQGLSQAIAEIRQAKLAAASPPAAEAAKPQGAPAATPRDETRPRGNGMGRFVNIVV